MKYYFLTDDSEKSLAPFFTKTVLSASFLSVVIIVATMFVFWPRQPLSSFIVAEKIPHTFFLIFAAILIVYCYVNLCCGCGDMIHRRYPIMKYPTDKSTYEKQIGFYQYGLIEFLLHTLILLLPFVPLLTLPAAISAASLIAFLKAVCILYTASLICRLMGFMVYLFWGRLSTLGYFVARAMMIVFILGTIFFAPFVNPLRQLYLLNQPPKSDGFAFVSYMVIVLLAILCLVVTNHILVRRIITRNGFETTSKG
jgi:hypothetical protein